MISPYQLLREAGFAQYTAMIRIHYNRDNTSLGAEKIAEMVRAIPGATRVSTVSLDKEHGIAIFNAKIISQKPPKEAYQALKQNALDRYRGLITGLEVGANTIETKGDFIIKESNTHLNQCLRGFLLEEGLLLEVSIEELRRQFVECDPQKLTPEVFEQIVQASNNQSNFATWLCKKVATNIINTEDLQLWSEIFEFFNRYKQRFQKKDLNQVKTAEDVHDFMNDYNRVKDDVEAKKATGQTQKVKDETDQCLLGTLKSSDGQEWLVYKTNPGQWSLERKIGSGTSWCTVASQHYFNYYMGAGGNNDRAYYIFINKKKPKEKYQIHYGSNQCKDREDHEVDYAEEFVQDFYKYLEKVDNRTQWSSKAIQGKEKLEARKEILQGLENEKDSVLDSLPKQTSEKGTVYSFNISGKTVRYIAHTFRDLGDQGAKCVARAERLHELGLSRYVIIVPKSGEWDLVGGQRYYFNSDLVSWKGTHADPRLPLANENNIDLYKDAAKLVTGEGGEVKVSIDQEVLIRCTSGLPDLSAFKVKSEGKRILYKFPKITEAERRSQELPRSARAMLQVGLTKYHIKNLGDRDYGQDYYAYQGPEITQEPYAVFTSRGKWLRPAGLSGTDADSLDKAVKVFAFADLESQNLGLNDSVRHWMELGGREGIISDINKSVNSERPEGIPDGYEVGSSEKIAKALSFYNRHSTDTSVSFLRKKDDNSKVLVNYGGLAVYSIQDNPFSITFLNTQGAIVRSQFTPEALLAFARYSNIEIPPALEKLCARTRGTTIQNVTKVLRDQADHFQQYSIPYCTARYNQNRIYSEDGTGVFGTWEQLGLAIRESSPQYYQKIAKVIQDNPGSRADVFLHYNRDSNRRSWNGVIRVINAENMVIWYARRYGNGEGCQWSLRDDLVEPQCRVQVGDAHTNYVAPQPQAPRAPRGQRAAAAAPATPAPEVAPEQQQQLEQYRQNINAAQNVYKIPTNQTELVRTLGFTSLAVNVANSQGNIVIYDVAAHRGNITRVALVNLQDSNVVVVSLPGNLTYGQAQGLSNQWRSLTRILDNSVRTFQQCVDVCNQTHTPLPVGLQGWLAYRGVNNA